MLRLLIFVAALCVLAQEALGPAIAVAQEEAGDAPTEPPPEASEPVEDEAAPEPEPESVAPRPTKSLRELTRLAAERAPNLRATIHRIEAAEAQLDEATYSPFFQITATANATLAPEAHGSPIFSPDRQLPIENPWAPIVRAGIEGAIPLWTFGKIGAARDAARAGLRAARHDRDRAHARMRYDVRRAYYSLQLALDVLQMIDEGFGRLVSAEERISEALDRGDTDVSDTDRFRLRAAIAEVEARRSEALRLEASARDALSTLTSENEIAIADCPSAMVELELEDVDRYVRRSVGHRPELRALAAGLDARRAAQDAAFARYFPDLALGFTASQSYGPGVTNQSNPFITDPANYSSLGAGLVVRWSLDFAGTAFRVARADAELRETELLAEAARSGVALEVRTAYRELEDARRREEAWGRGHRDGRAWLIAATQAYQVGTAEARELVDAVKAYFTARFSHLQAILDHNTAVAKLSLMIGEDLLQENAWEIACE